MPYIIGYIGLVNIVAALVTVADKRRARRGAWRVPERVLWLLAVGGGALGMLCTMRRIRHKTQHRRFMWGLPLLMAAQVAAALWLMWHSI